MEPKSEAGRALDREEAIEKALLYTFQLSGKDYRKMQTAMSEVAFIRALEQDGYTVAALAASPTAPGTEDGIVMRGHVPTIRCWCGEDHDG